MFEIVLKLPRQINWQGFHNGLISHFVTLDPVIYIIDWLEQNGREPSERYEIKPRFGAPLLFQHFLLIVQHKHGSFGHEGSVRAAARDGGSEDPPGPFTYDACPLHDDAVDGSCYWVTLPVRWYETDTADGVLGFSNRLERLHLPKLGDLHSFWGMSIYPKSVRKIVLSGDYPPTRFP